MWRLTFVCLLFVIRPGNVWGQDGEYFWSSPPWRVILDIEGKGFGPGCLLELRQEGLVLEFGIFFEGGLVDVVHPSLNGKAGDTLVFTAQPGDSEWQMSGNKATQTGARFVVPPMMLSDALDEWAAGGVTDFVIAAGREGPPIAAEAPDLAAATAALRSCRDVIGVW